MNRRQLLFAAFAAASSPVLAGISRSQNFDFPNYDAFQESFSGFDFLYSQANERREFRNYTQRRGDLDNDLDQWQRKPQSQNPRFAAYAKLINAVRKFDDPKLKLILINGWVNTVINFDTIKAQKSSDPKKDNLWMQTPQETLMRGQGVCCDFALLKYEASRRAGLTEDQIYYVRVEQNSFDDNCSPITQGHALTLYGDGRSAWALTNQNPQNLTIVGDVDRKLTQFWYNSFIEDSRVYFAKINSSFFYYPEQKMKPSWAVSEVSKKVRALDFGEKSADKTQKCDFKDNWQTQLNNLCLDLDPQQKPVVLAIIESAFDLAQASGPAIPAKNRRCFVGFKPASKAVL